MRILLLWLKIHVCLSFAVEECLKIGATLSHEDQVTLLYDEEVKKLEQQNITLRYYALPEINIATNQAYDDLRHLHDEVNLLIFITFNFKRF